MTRHTLLSKTALICQWLTILFIIVNILLARIMSLRKDNKRKGVALI